MDGFSVLVAAVIATLLEFQATVSVKEVWNAPLAHRRSIGILLAILLSFALTLMLTNRHLNLYGPTRLHNILHEQRLSVQACLTASLLLAGVLYLIHAEDVPRSIVLLTLGLVTVFQSLRRLFFRILLNRRLKNGVGTRNALIVGTGPEANALRLHFENVRHLGYSFVGFIANPDSGASFTDIAGDVVGTHESLFQLVRRRFVDEIFVTAPCKQGMLRELLEKARTYDVDLRLVPEMHGGLVWNGPIEYVGQFPTVPLHRNKLPAGSPLFKRGLDISVSSLTLLLLSPLFAAIAIAIKLDSKGPVFYSSQRIGKKGRAFRCIKFRTMVQDAESQRDDLMHLNERDGVLFKIADDPRITKLGHFLRKYSLDELPQFLNVLRGDMSVVGPRPPLVAEVQEYKLNHFRRLDVNPGITGLWQVQARQDPSFDNYISLDMAYVERWSIWLDFKIMIRTIGVVLAGTGC